MRKVAIVTDSTSDLGKEIREKYDIRYVKMSYSYDGKEYPASLDWEALGAHEFYDLMRNGVIMKTSLVMREEFVTVFTDCLENGYDIVYISCSSALSGSVNSGRLVADQLREKYPEAEIYCVDSRISSLGQGMITVDAAKMRDNGKSAAEIAAEIEKNRLKYNQFGAVANLEYLRRAGRVKASKAFFGNLFGIRPILLSDVIGQNYAFKKAKGAANARKEIASLIAEVAEDSENSVLCISHADDIEEAEKLRDEILAKRAFRDVYINYIGPIVGASVGPGTIIAFAYGKEVTIEGKD